jgi:hypothetical protein
MRAWIGRSFPRRLPRTSNLLPHRMVSPLQSAAALTAYRKRVKVELARLVPILLLRPAERKPRTALHTCPRFVDVEILGNMASAAEHLLGNVAGNSAFRDTRREGGIVLPPLRGSAISTDRRMPNQWDIPVPLFGRPSTLSRDVVRPAPLRERMRPEVLWKLSDVVTAC